MPAPPHHTCIPYLSMDILWPDNPNRSQMHAPVGKGRKMLGELMDDAARPRLRQPGACRWRMDEKMDER